MAASTIPAAKAALLTAIQARVALAGVHVAWGVPADLPAEPERIYVGDAVDVSRVWASLGAYRLDESYTLQVHVETFAGGNDQRTVEERLWVLVNEVEQAVRGDLTLAGAVRVTRPDPIDSRTLPTDDGWAASATWRLAVEARI
jgi:hypothetical protein